MMSLIVTGKIYEMNSQVLLRCLNILWIFIFLIVAVNSNPVRYATQPHSHIEVEDVTSTKLEFKVYEEQPIGSYLGSIRPTNQLKTTTSKDSHKPKFLSHLETKIMSENIFENLSDKNNQKVGSHFHEFIYSIVSEAVMADLHLFTVEKHTGVIRTGVVIDRDALCPSSSGLQQCYWEFDVLEERISNKNGSNGQSRTRGQLGSVENYYGKEKWIMKRYRRNTENSNIVERKGLVNKQDFSNKTEIKFKQTKSDHHKSNQNTIFYTLHSGININHATGKRGTPATHPGALRALEGKSRTRSALKGKPRTRRAMEGKPRTRRALEGSQRMIRVKIEIMDINDNPPNFPQDEIMLEISEAAELGSGLTVPPANDPDSGKFSVQSYKLAPSDAPFALEVIQSADSMDSPIIRLVLQRRLDRESIPQHRLVLEVLDGGSPPLSGVLMVVISVTDSNDNPPVFENNGTYDVTVREDETRAGLTLIQVRASDADTDNNSHITYSLSSRTRTEYEDLFSINPLTGEVQLGDSLDFETQSVYLLNLEASDSGTEPLQRYGSILLTVLDSNDNHPEIRTEYISTDEETDKVKLVENYGGPGQETVLAHVITTDRDTGSGGKVSCHVTDERFSLIVMYDGRYMLVTSHKFDREMEEVVTVQINCSDNGNPALTSSVNVSVTILDENDNGPRFLREFYSITIPENNEIGTELVTVSAVDDDTGDNGRLEYHLDDNASKYLHINPSTGQITSAVSFDREKIRELNFFVFARDLGRVVSRSSSSRVRLNIEDLDDERPVFHPASFSFGVLENQPKGTIVGHVTALDSDSPPYDKFIYGMKQGGEGVTGEGERAGEGDVWRWFNLDPLTGRITTREVLDREMQTEYELIVEARADSDDLHPSTARVTVVILDENDNRPRFIHPPAPDTILTLSSLTPAGETILTARAEDLDSFDTNPDNGLVYSMQIVQQGGIGEGTSEGIGEEGANKIKEGLAVIDGAEGVRGKDGKINGVDGDVAGEDNEEYNDDDDDNDYVDNDDTIDYDDHLSAGDNSNDINNLLNKKHNLNKLLQREKLSNRKDFYNTNNDNNNNDDDSYDDDEDEDDDDDISMSDDIEENYMKNFYDLNKDYASDDNVKYSQSKYPWDFTEPNKHDNLRVTFDDINNEPQEIKSSRPKSVKSNIKSHKIGKSKKIKRSIEKSSSVTTLRLKQHKKNTISTELSIPIKPRDYESFNVTNSDNSNQENLNSNKSKKVAVNVNNDKALKLNEVNSLDERLEFLQSNENGIAIVKDINNVKQEEVDWSRVLALNRVTGALVLQMSLDRVKSDAVRILLTVTDSGGLNSTVSVTLMIRRDPAYWSLLQYTRHLLTGQDSSAYITVLALVVTAFVIVVIITSICLVNRLRERGLKGSARGRAGAQGVRGHPPPDVVRVQRSVGEVGGQTVIPSESEESGTDSNQSDQDSTGLQAVHTSDSQSSTVIHVPCAVRPQQAIQTSLEQCINHMASLNRTAESIASAAAYTGPKRPTTLPGSPKLRSGSPITIRATYRKTPFTACVRPDMSNSKLQTSGELKKVTSNIECKVATSRELIEIGAKQSDCSRERRAIPWSVLPSRRTRPLEAIQSRPGFMGTHESMTSSEYVAYPPVLVRSSNFSLAFHESGNVVKIGNSAIHNPANSQNSLGRDGSSNLSTFSTLRRAERQRQTQQQSTLTLNGNQNQNTTVNSYSVIGPQGFQSPGVSRPIGWNIPRSHAPATDPIGRRLATIRPSPNFETEDRVELHQYQGCPKHGHLYEDF